jgi:hypothetical protein
MLGMETLENRSWHENCPEHGVGTEYFKGLGIMPFGYKNERKTSRESWIRYQKKCGIDLTE